MNLFKASSIIGLLFLFIAVRYAFALLMNIRAAKKSGMPYVVRLTPSGNPFWMIFGNKIIALLERLPFRWVGQFKRFNLHGWEANERHRMYEEHGDIVLIVTPKGNLIYVGDPVAITEILRRKDEFRRNTKSRKMLDIFDKSLTSTDGPEWQRHRKVTATSFTEKNTELVWVESLKQAQGMLEYWTQRATAPIRSLQLDTQTFTTNVLAAAMLSKPYKFVGKEDPPPTDDSEEEKIAYEYREALSVILENVIAIMVLGKKVLQKKWMPVKLQKAGAAVERFRDYAETLIEDEKARIQSGSQQTVPTLVNLMVRACASEVKSGTKTLTESEIVSNLFVYAFAGRDTTAITLSHMIVFMAAHPEIQDWAREEIHHYLPDQDSSTWEYAKFAKLKRCLAVMYETLRLCHPSVLLLKVTPPHPINLDVNGKSHLIPANSAIHGSLSAMHTHPDFYGPDPLSWRPSRFITATEKSESGDIFAAETIPADTTVDFLAWSSGPRACPGKKFAQVEVVAVLAKMLYEHRVEAVPEPGESVLDAQNRLHGLCMTVEQKAIFNMKEPHKAGVRWVKC
ncbi:cytochrome P450 [Pseudovirgaria hyperparasitica]|uniref:Cytochrome P450 n=1 Tax=Pseudovirgaria hyperparasitica TaxID=470096 RepID=A0A6A6W702_9PEZI|nr:cytochrome P450 [Pseudovirgaria hyperparasitica]KAF2757347.1 cytochrome P450 [Pseudovirgaria hyperparasitica]